MKQSDLIINETIDLAERYMSITEQILEDFKNGNGNLNKLFLIKFCLFKTKTPFTFE